MPRGSGAGSLVTRGQERGQGSLAMFPNFPPCGTGDPRAGQAGRNESPVSPRLVSLSRSCQEGAQFGHDAAGRGQSQAVTQLG